MEEASSMRGMTLIKSIAVIIACAMAGLASYSIYINSRLAESLHATLYEVAVQKRNSIQSTVQGETRLIQSIAAALFYGGDSLERRNLYLREVSAAGNFAFFGVADLDGNANSTIGPHFSVKNEEFFQRALNGETLLLALKRDKLWGEANLVLATPLRSGEADSLKGVLFGVYRTTALENLFFPSFKGEGYVYLVTAQGKVLAKSENAFSLNMENINLALQEADIFHYDDQATVREKLLSGEDGHARYAVRGVRRVMHFLPAGINDWRVVSVIPDAMISDAVDIAVRGTAVLSLAVLALFSLSLVGMFLMRRKHTRALHRLAYIDPLTGIANMVKFRLDAAAALERGGRWAFVLLNVNRMKVFNATFGFRSGDMLLCGMARTLQELLEDDEILCRSHADEFRMLLRYEDNAVISLRIREMFAIIAADTRQRLNVQYNISFSAAVYVIEDNSESLNSIVDKARYARYGVEYNPESDMAFYDERQKLSLQQEQEMESLMNDALANGEFKVFLQPKFRTRNEILVGAEALVRWKSGDRDIKYPSVFIPLFERNGFIVKLDVYIFERVCALIRQWLDTGLPPVAISVNFSRLHLSNPGFVSELCALADKYRVPRKLLEIELTESTMLENEEVLMQVLNSLHRAGFILSMDDFGSGYSSLNLLKSIPVDVIKIDRYFFAFARDAHRARTVIANVIRMAKELNIRTVAEGVECREHIVILRELGCDVVQGYYYAKPMPMDEMTAYMRRAREHSPGAITAAHFGTHYQKIAQNQSSGALENPLQL